MGDVVRDLPEALARTGWNVIVATPSYGMFHRLPGAAQLADIDVEFNGERQAVNVYEVPGSSPQVRNIAFEHAIFSPQGAGRIYCDDDASRPFATDAGKFAFFSAVAASWINAGPGLPDIVHLHDWHAATYGVLREYADEFRRLQAVRTVFTIHNLAYQGIRPISGDESSLESWFPGLRYIHSKICDPHLPHCYNPMAAAIRLADGISTVSPTYATEICRASDDTVGFIGGEGLEDELRQAQQAGRLIGILNGCEYVKHSGRRPGWNRLVTTMTAQVDAWLEASPDDRRHLIARDRLRALPKRRPKHVLTSIGRLVRQKAALMVQPLTDGRPAIEHLLENLGKSGVLVVLGSGETEFENAMADIAGRSPNLVFLCGYSESLSEPLYRAGDLFLMPSSFEPCGISQMLAMKAAQPCVVHGVGGLRDTVEDDKTGFVFNGSTPKEQAAEFVARVENALAIKAGDGERWQDICIRAASKRFSWAESARQTVEKLYVND